VLLVGLQGDDDLSADVACFEMPDGLGDLAQGIGPVDDWATLPASMSSVRTGSGTRLGVIAIARRVMGLGGGGRPPEAGQVATSRRANRAVPTATGGAPVGNRGRAALGQRLQRRLATAAQ
jgi:hypothetical protein